MIGGVDPERQVRVLLEVERQREQHLGDQCWQAKCGGRGRLAPRGAADARPLPEPGLAEG